MGLEETLMYLGRWGRYQMITYLFIAICMNFPTAWQLYGIVFEGPSVPVSYSCAPKPEIGLADSADPCSQWKFDEKKENSLVARDSRLNQTIGNYTYFYKEKEDCSKFEYNPSLIGYKFPKEDGTIQQKWDLVCKKGTWVTWSQVVYTGGALVGATLCPPFGDYFGRRKTFFMCQLFMCIFGIGMAFSPNFASFCVFQFLTGGFAIGNDLCGFVIACELFPKDMRSVLSPLLYLFFSTGSAILTAWTLAFPKWNHLQLAISIAPFITFCYFPFCPESWRWLMAKGRNDEAEFYLNKAAKFNGLKPIDRSILLDNVMKDNKSIPVKKQRIIDFFKRPKLILYMASMGFIMSSSNLVYFGLNLMSGALAGDPYINYMALALVEIIGVFMAIASVSYYGRRIPIMLFFFWGAVFMFLAVIFTKVESLKDDLGEKKLGDFVTSFTIIGKIGITAAYCVILVYIQEIYPTYMRAFGIGMTAGLGNIGSILAPVALLASQLEVSKYWIPTTIFGIVSFVAGLVTLILPETVGRELPATPEDVLNMTRSLSDEEWKVARNQARILFRCFYKKSTTADQGVENIAFEGDNPGNTSDVSVNKI